MGRNLCVLLCFFMCLQLGSCGLGDFLVSVVSRIGEVLKDSTTKFLESFGVFDSGESSPPSPPTTNNPAYYVELPDPPVCGISNASFPRVVGGEDAKLGAFPWMALVKYQRDDIERYACGGTLVSSQHVLTAAHCIHPEIEQYLRYVRLGELDYADDNDGAPHMDVPVIEKIRHEGHDKMAKINDIALLVLDREITFTELIKPICLPESQDLRKRNFVKHWPFVAGWGQLKPMGEYSTRLQYLQLPVIKEKLCLEVYPPSYTIDERVICAGYKMGSKDTCHGDSGGPLMQPIRVDGLQKIPFYQIGVVAYGIAECGQAPAVYSRVTYFIPWIVEKITGKTIQ